ncbi:MAG TPA: PTS sugar transporter subunit IIA [Rhodothermia bacterium]|nr:PTS sugar transporter subunit IIA [Rhodothermia bacterium]
MAATENTATLGDLLEAGSVHVGIVAENKTDLLQQLINSFRGFDGVTDLQAVADSVFEREAMLSTGVGYGIALPHAKTKAVSKTLAVFATTSKAIDYDSFDQQPVRLVFMLIGPPNASRDHIRVLGRISRLLQMEQIREKLLEARTPAEIIDILHSAEDRIPTQ